ncbi:DUF5074 domain-containing protein [Pseudopedobacter sp.]|uniref:YncE family protein n=1 Tax=Pseudopedobacter sp. TaxID=1936787 RepID=UPI0033409382
MRTNTFKALLTILSLSAIFFSSCKKDKTEPQFLGEITDTKGIYILNEGNMGGGNSTITYYDITTGNTITDYYKQVNGTNLGESANDLKQYGSKMYCVVSGKQSEKSSFVDVIDIATGKSLKRIPFNGETGGYMPRYITFYKNKAYVSRYDGVVSRIDTTSLTVDGNLQLKNGDINAEALEGLAVANGKLYVAGSSHYLYENSLEDKVVVVDLTTFTETKRISVSDNPAKIVAAENGDLLVTSLGIYLESEPALTKISSTTDAVAETYEYSVGALAMYKNNAYIAKDWAMVFPFDITTGTLGASFVTNVNVSIVSPYGITVNGFDESVVIADAISYSSTEGKVYVFDKDGKVKYNFKSAQGPQSAVFNYTYR